MRPEFDVDERNLTGRDRFEARSRISLTFSGHSVSTIGGIVVVDMEEGPFLILMSKSDSASLVERHKSDIDQVRAIR